MIIEFGEFLGNRADLNVAASTEEELLDLREQQKSHINATGSYFWSCPMS